MQKLLKSIVDENILFFKKHSPPRPRVKSKDAIITVRNPWDWYVSLWAYGCSGRGALRQRLVRREAEYSRLYQDFGDKGAFRHWLQLIHGSDVSGSRIPGEQYSESLNDRVIGFYTHRWLRMVLLGYPVRVGKDASLADLQRLYEKRALNPVVIHQENLEDDLIFALDRLPVKKKEHWKETVLQALDNRQNTSKHHGYRDYYDDVSVALVQEREKMFIDRFSYDF